MNENDPEYKRFIYIENEEGKVELVDLLAGEVDAYVSVSDVSYDLYTATTQNSPVTITNNNVGALANTKFNPALRSLFVVHGWTNSRSSDINKQIRATAFNHNINLFIVDWSGPARKDYLSAKTATVEVGKIIGSFINSIQAVYGLDGSNFVLAGHSLGAHVVGNAGKVVTKQVAHIIGMDPAGPLYTLTSKKERLAAGDAKFVQIIHTNGLILGMSSSIGDSDFYPNGGMTQPGCPVDTTGLCAHAKAYLYFAEALSRGDVFVGRACSSYTSYLTGACLLKNKSSMALLEPR